MAREVLMTRNGVPIFVDVAGKKKVGENEELWYIQGEHRYWGKPIDGCTGRETEVRRKVDKNGEVLIVKR